MEIIQKNERPIAAFLSEFDNKKMEKWRCCNIQLYTEGAKTLLLFFVK